ncbi:GNAT family N-acetyltransferase [Deinococcus sp.]|uniref:GNAT family N-acetyltransferase n=1 Tax=Deinococcus sp. TaxID=47478 RepID=UPI0025EE78FA|nr:GNAT family N-acetyltransferase [Deinococcus sp.]
MLAIYNDAVASTTASYDYDPVTLESRQVWLLAKQAGDWPVLVATQTQNGPVMGFASYGPFRAWRGYLHTAEHSV